MDVLIVWKLDRFGLLISDRPDPMTNCILQVMAAFAELEREVIRERTLLGMDAARKRAVH